MNIQICFGQVISQSSSKPLIVKGFICLECQVVIVFLGLRKGNCRNGRNIAAILRAVVKSHNRLKGTKVFACACSGRDLKFFSKFAGKSPCWGPFVVKLQHVMAYKRLLGQLYQKRDAYTETLTRSLSVNFGKNMNTTINTSPRLPLK